MHEHARRQPVATDLPHVDAERVQSDQEPWRADERVSQSASERVIQRASACRRGQYPPPNTKSCVKTDDADEVDFDDTRYTPVRCTRRHSTTQSPTAANVRSPAHASAAIRTSSSDDDASGRACREGSTRVTSGPINRRRSDAAL